MVCAIATIPHTLLVALALGVQVTLTNGTDSLGETLRDSAERRGWGLDLMGVPLVIYSIRKILQIKGRVELIWVPPELESALGPLKQEFGSSQVMIDGRANGPPEKGDVVLPSDGLVVADGTGYRIDRMVDPWDLLEATQRVLRQEVTERRIADSAEIASTAVIDGPCFISEGAKVDDFCKIAGPVFIGPQTKVWTGSLVRESMIGPNCEIGFGCEVGRTYMLGADRVSHHDVILDSVLGWNTWMGAFIGTTNKLLNNSNVKYKKGEELVDTGRQHFGAVFGHDSAIGAGTIILPGRLVPSRAIVQAGTLYTGQDGQASSTMTAIDSLHSVPEGKLIANTNKDEKTR
jgi:acetyltransferase-like isoleucine patch superfamily enzyme